MRFKVAFFIFFFLGTFLSFSQTGLDATVKMKKDSTSANEYYQILKKTLITGIIFKYSDDGIVIPTTDDTLISYSGATPLKVGANLSYSWFNVRFLVASPYRLSENKEGTQIQLQNRIYIGRKFATYLFWNRTRGFNKFLEPIYRSDIVRSNIGGSLAYIFNGNRYSYKSLFNYQEIQKRSAGSFIAELYYLNIAIAADSNIIPTNLNAKGDFSLPSFRRNIINSYGASMGYGYTFVWRSFLAGAFLAVGANIDNSKDVDNVFNLSTKAFFKIAYGAKRVRTDLYMNFLEFHGSQSGVLPRVSQNYITFNVSYQLNTKKYKFFNKVDKFMSFKFIKK